MKTIFWTSARGFLVIAAGVLLFWIANIILMNYYFHPLTENLSSAGAAGDMFGGLNALFSGLAFAGLIAALFMQRHELSLQRTELELQRRELAQTREVFHVQRFENTFFGMIGLLSGHVGSLRVNKIQRPNFPQPKNFDVATGRDAIAVFAKYLPSAQQIREKPDQYGNVEETAGDDKEFTRLMNEYEEYYEKSLENYLGPYFRIIYNIIKLIENTNFGDTEEEDLLQKGQYAKILRSHMSSLEIKILLFNGLSKRGLAMKKWIEKYSLLKHISNDDYVAYANLTKRYASDAFDQNDA